MAHDEQGNLHPLMLSELIAFAQATLAEHGDMPVWAHTEKAGYDDNIRQSVPVGYEPSVSDGKITREYWGDRYAKAFVISGSETG